MQIADCSINRGAERLSERGERDGKKAETFPGGETERRSSAPAAAGAAPPQTPGGARAHKEARRSRARKPPRGSESARTPRRGAGQGGTGAPARSEREPKAEGREDAPQRPGAPRERGKGRGEGGSRRASARAGTARNRNPCAQTERRPPGAEGQAPGERPGARSGRGRPPEPQRGAGMASRKRGGDGTSRTPARAHTFFVPSLRGTTDRERGPTPEAGCPVQTWSRTSRRGSAARTAGMRIKRRTAPARLCGALSRRDSGGEGGANGGVSRLPPRGRDGKPILDIGTLFRQNGF